MVNHILDVSVEEVVSSEPNNDAEGRTPTIMVVTDEENPNKHVETNLTLKHIQQAESKVTLT